MNKIDKISQACATEKQKLILTDGKDFSGDKAQIQKTTEKRIRNLKDLVEVCEIDLTEWEVERWVCNKWEVGGFNRATRVGTEVKWTRSDGRIKIKPLFQVKAWLRRKTELIAARAEIEELQKKASGWAPKYPPVKSKASATGNLAEFSLVDHHFGALIWGKETRGPDWDLKLSEAAWKTAAEKLILRTSHLALDESVVVLGNDQQNADNRQGSTEKGTPQTMDGRYQKVFSVSRNCSIWFIEHLREISRKVTVVIVPGNHDPLSAWYLGDSLTAWFRNCPEVEVDNRPTNRKYRQHGNVMLMWTHGNYGKLEDYGSVMASEEPQMWGNTSWREAHTGDKHQRRLLELKGASVRILPSLRPPDAWSSENHFIGSIRAAEAYVWNSNEGLISTATYSILRQ